MSRPLRTNNAAHDVEEQVPSTPAAWTAAVGSPAGVVNMRRYR